MVSASEPVLKGGCERNEEVEAAGIDEVESWCKDKRTEVEAAAGRC